MRVKNITITVSIRVSVTVQDSLVLFVCITVSVRVSAMVWGIYTLQNCVMRKILCGITVA